MASSARQRKTFALEEQSYAECGVNPIKKTRALCVQKNQALESKRVWGGLRRGLGFFFIETLSNKLSTPSSGHGKDNEDDDDGLGHARMPRQLKSVHGEIGESAFLSNF